MEIARVGNDYLMLEEALSEIPEFLIEEDSVKVLQKYREEWIQKKILLQEARRLQLQQNREVQNKIEKARQEILIDALKDAVLSKVEEDITVSDEEARNYYQANKEQFILNERFVRFRHMVSRDLGSAREAKRALLRGKPWPEVAAQYAIWPDKLISESREFWPISMAVKDNSIMHRYLQIIGHQEISPIQRVDNHYHFVQLMESRAKGEHPELGWLIEQIKEWLLLDKRRRHFSSYVKNLYLKAKSNNEIKTFNVIKPDTNSNLSIKDTLETTNSDE